MRGRTRGVGWGGVGGERDAVCLLSLHTLSLNHVVQAITTLGIEGQILYTRCSSLVHQVIVRNRKAGQRQH